MTNLSANHPRVNEARIGTAWLVVIFGLVWAHGDLARCAMLYFAGALLTLVVSIKIDRRPLYIPEALFWPALLGLLGVLVLVLIARGDSWEDYASTGCNDPACRECREAKPDVETEAVVALLFGTGLLVSSLFAAFAP